MLRPRRLGLATAAIFLLVLVGLSPSAPSRGSGLSDESALGGRSAAGSGTVMADVQSSAAVGGSAAGAGTVSADVQSSAAVARGATGSGTVWADAQPATRVDDQGYTIWGGPIDYGGPPWCIFDSNSPNYEFGIYLGDQDPMALSDASLNLVFAEMMPYAKSGVPDPFWTVMLNGNPLDPALYAEWYWGEEIYEALPDVWLRRETLDAPPQPFSIPISPTQLIEGRNGVRLKNDELPSPSTCTQLYRLELKARVDDPSSPIKVSKVSPKNLAKNVDFEDPGITVKFTQPYLTSTVNLNTFEVTFRNMFGSRVPVRGKVIPTSDTTATFIPEYKLMAGVRYYIDLWDRPSAEAVGRTEWIRKAGGSDLEVGASRSFWTMPDLQVKVVPVQVVENAPLIVGKRTAIKTFLRWDLGWIPNVFPPDQLPEVAVDNVTVSWSSEFITEFTDWKKGEQEYWTPKYEPANLVRRREYLEFTNPRESYNKAEKYRAEDSINFIWFDGPETDGGHSFQSVVDIKDDRGRIRHFPSAAVQLEATDSIPYNIHFRALKVGSWLTSTATIRQDDSIGMLLRGVKSVYPFRSVPLHTPTSGGVEVYVPTYQNLVVRGLWGDQGLAVYDLDGLCRQTDDCDMMVGIAPADFMTHPGLALELTPRAVLIRKVDAGREPVRFVLAHEVGHQILGGGYNDDEGQYFESLKRPAGEGFDVTAYPAHLDELDRRRSVRRLPWNGRKPVTLPTEELNFMTADPQEDETVDLWIQDKGYMHLINDILPGLIEGHVRPAGTGVQAQDVSSGPRLLAMGFIDPTTDSVYLRPWYQLDPGHWKAPATGDYQFAFLGSGGDVLASYPFQGEVVTTTATSLPPFALKVPYPAATAKIQIKHGATVLKEIVSSANAPDLTITSPAAGATWSGSQTVTWTASDQDGDSLVFSIHASADNGRTWIPIAADLTGTSYTVDSAIMNSTKNALIRVLATDGLRTTSRTAGPFTVSNPLNVAYVSPSAGITNVHTSAAVVVAFAEEMDPSTVTTGTISMAGGGFATIGGTVTYSSADREATLHPRLPLAFSTDYTVTVSTGIRSIAGTAMTAPKSWSFRTEDDQSEARPVAFFPLDGEMAAPLNGALAVVWSKDLNPSTLTAARFVLTSTTGATVAGAVSYDAASKTAKLVPSAELSPNTWYVATLKAGIEDTGGGATEGDFVWTFRTGTTTLQSVAFTGGFSDSATDDDGDGLFDRLVIRVGVQVTATGAYSLSGTLVDASGEVIARGRGGALLQPGAQFVDLTFPGAAIGGHRVDGPYTLTRLLFYKANDARFTTVLDDAYQTFAYVASQFFAPLTFVGLPDVKLLPGASRYHAFNVRDYARHVSLASNQLTYSITMYTADEAGVTLGSDGFINVDPWSDWSGSSRVTVRAGASNDYAEATFDVSVGWQHRVNLPSVVKTYGGSSSALSRSSWKTVFSESFEDTLPPTWQLWSHNPRPKWYRWDRRNCMASSGSYSGWPYGGNDDGSLLSCGADYPNNYMGAMAYGPAINLKYVGQAEFRMRVWTDLDAGDTICAVVSTDPYGDIWQKTYYGVCKTGKSQGWEDLVLDLSQVPTLGNVLGKDQVWVAVEFTTNSAGTRPNGAFVDDVSVRVCPAGLTCR